MNCRALNNLKYYPGKTGNFNYVCGISLSLLSWYLPSLSVSFFSCFSAPLFLSFLECTVSIPLSLSGSDHLPCCCLLHLDRPHSFSLLSSISPTAFPIHSSCLLPACCPTPHRLAQNFVQLAVNNSVLSNVEKDIYILQEWASILFALIKRGVGLGWALNMNLCLHRMIRASLGALHTIVNHGLAAGSYS